MATKPAGKTEDFVCHVCLRETEHSILREVIEDWSSPIDEELYVSGRERYEIVRCNGCRNVAYVHRSWFSEDWPTDPPALKRFPPVPVRARPAWMTDEQKNIPTGLLNLLSEVYASLDAKATTIAAMGARSVFEYMMLSQIEDQNNFQKNLDAFITAGFVGERSRELLAKVLEVGHAAIHRGHEVGRQDMLVILGLIESLVELIYIHPHSINSMKTPPSRPTRVKKAKSA